MLFELWKHSPDGAGVFRGEGQVVVSSHRLAREVLLDGGRFSPANALDAVTPLPAAVLRELARHRFRLPATLANNDTGTHSSIRSAFAETFAPHRVEALRPWLRGLTRRAALKVALRLREGKAVDLDKAVSSEVPLAALARLLELDVDEAAEVKRFSRAALELFWGRPDLDRQLELAKIVGPYHAVLRGWAAKSTGATRQVLKEHGEDAATAALFFLLVAGQETTSQFLTLLLHKLIEEPKLLDAPAAAVVEEGLRLLPPLVSWRRLAARDTEIGGMPVNKDESILVWLAAAGADEGVAECPHRMKPGQRGSRRHLAFGAGAHRCLGSQLSRMEAEVVVSELAPLLRRCEVVAAPVSDENLSFRMPSPLVVALSGSLRGRPPGPDPRPHLLPVRTVRDARMYGKGFVGAVAPPYRQRVAGGHEPVGRIQAHLLLAVADTASVGHIPRGDQDVVMRAAGPRPPGMDPQVQAHSAHHDVPDHRMAGEEAADGPEDGEHEGTRVSHDEPPHRIPHPYRLLVHMFDCVASGACADAGSVRPGARPRSRYAADWAALWGFLIVRTMSHTASTARRTPTM
nr:cytochrome P450 [Glycomyces arizonensis]